MRKALLSIPALILLATPALSQTAGSSSGAISGSSVNYSPTSINIPSKRLDTTAGAFAPSLTSGGVDACAGSWGIGVGVTGFGLSGGSTYELKGCTMRANAAALNAVAGRATAAYYLASQDEGMRQALIATGVLAAPVQTAAPVAAYANMKQRPAGKADFCDRKSPHFAPTLCR